MGEIRLTKEEQVLISQSDELDAKPQFKSSSTVKFEDSAPSGEAEGPTSKLPTRNSTLKLSSTDKRKTNRQLSMIQEEEFKAGGTPATSDRSGARGRFLYQNHESQFTQEEGSGQLVEDESPRVEAAISQNFTAVSDAVMGD